MGIEMMERHAVVDIELAERQMGVDIELVERHASVKVSHLEHISLQLLAEHQLRGDRGVLSDQISVDLDTYKVRDNI
jgi:hypothetical protein